MNEQNSNDLDIVGKVLGLLDGGLDVVHDKIIRPIVRVGRFVAFGFVIAVAGLLIAIGLTLATFRFFDNYVFKSMQWLTYIVIGAVFLSVGLLLWRKRRAPKERTRG